MWHAPALAVAPCVSGEWKSRDWDDDGDGDGGNPNLESRVTGRVKQVIQQAGRFNAKFPVIKFPNLLL